MESVSSKKTSIRLASPEKVYELKRFVIDQFREHGIELAEDRIGEAIAGLLVDSRWGFILLAEQQKSIIGFACMSLIWTLEHGGVSAW